MSLAARDIDEFYRTNDMAAVTFLKLKGHPVQEVIWQMETCFWVFRITEALLDDNEEFADGQARVEPREYNRVFGETKKELYNSKNQLRRR